MSEVMEHRETSRIGEDDGSGLEPGPGEVPRAPSRRFARLIESPAARRPALDRIGRALLALAAVAGLAVVAGSSLSRSVVAWLHRQRDYRVRFADIVLDPPPPPWIEGGRPALLESIRDGRKHLETLSVLDLDLDRLLTDVRRNPWVARADRAVKSYPDQVAVSLSYREPVALVRTATGPPIPVDREGVALPHDGLDAARAGPLATIEDDPASTPPGPGLAWPGDPRARASPRTRVVRGARLAGHLKDALRGVGPKDWRPESVLILVDEPKHTGFWVEFDGTLVLWGRYATLDAPGDPSDSEKWRTLAAKAKADGGLKSLGPDEYLDANDGMRVHKIR